MPYTARKFSSETRIRLLSKTEASSDMLEDDLPPLLKQQSRGLLREKEPESDSLSLKEPLFYACLLASFVFVFFSLY